MADERLAREPRELPDPDLVELVVVALPEVSATVRVAEALRQLVAQSSIRILDLVVVTARADGGFTAMEPEAVGGLALLHDVEGEVGGLLSSDDVALACSALPPDTTALLLVIEDSWAAPLAEAARAVGGRVVGGDRIGASRLAMVYGSRSTPGRETR